jgi:hypothetical protein
LFTIRISIPKIEIIQFSIPCLTTFCDAYISPFDPHSPDSIAHESMNTLSNGPSPHQQTGKGRDDNSAGVSAMIVGNDSA